MVLVEQGAEAVPAHEVLNGIEAQMGQLGDRLADRGPVAACRPRDRAQGRPVGLERRRRDEELPEGAGVHIAELAALGERDDDVGVLGLGVLGRLDPEQLPAHPEMHDQRVPAVEREEQVLAQPPHRFDGVALEQGAEVLGRGVAAHRAAVGHRDGLDLAAHHLTGQVLAQGLYFGQLRHW